MIKFKKVKESVENFDSWCYLRIRDLRPNRDFLKYSDKEIIDAVNKSKFHFWKGEEEPNGQTISLTIDNRSKILRDYKFYGFFDNDKLSSSNYTRIAFEDFKNKILDSIFKFSEGDHTFEIKAQTLINDVLNPTSKYYHLDINVETFENLVAPWTPYSVFNAFLSIDRENNIATLIEFGDD